MALFPLKRLLILKVEHRGTPEYFCQGFRCGHNDLLEKHHRCVRWFFYDELRGYFLSVKEDGIVMLLKKKIC